MDLIFNKYQTPVTEEELSKLPQEIQEQFLDAINNIPYVQSLIAIDRPYAKDLPRDEEGKIIVDITKPHILEDTDYFRPTALHYKQYGCFTKLKPNANPNSEYGKWIREEIRRCWEGYVRPSDGEWIPGDMYFFLNYCPIQLIKKSAKGDTIRTIDFPSFWDGHYYKFHYLYQCRKEGKHAFELASRFKGKSYCGAALLAKRFILGESDEVRKKVQCVVTASERKYIQGANQLLDMFQYYIDFCANNTEFPSQRLTSSLQNMQWTMGYMDVDSGTRRGTQNSVIGITSKDDESKLRGSRGVLYLLEETGCHLKGTECFKADKTVEKVENIKVGDSLLGPDMKPRKVLKVFHGITDMYKITLSNGDTQIVTDNHPVYVKVRTWGKTTKENFRTFTCKELLERDYKKGHYIVKQPIIYKHKDVLIDPYMLGLWLGDGDSSRISFAASEIEIKNYFNSFGDKCYLRHCTNTNKCDVAHFSVHKNQELYKAFNKYNLFNNKHIPDDYMHNSKDVLLNLLAGFIDSDGYYDNKRHLYEIIQHSSRKQIIYSLKEICEDLGMKCTISTKIGGSNALKPGELYYRIFIRSNIVIPVKINKKKFNERSHYRNKLNWSEYSFTIEPYGKGEYFGFLLDKDHLFILKDRTIVHNTFPRLLNLYQVMLPSVQDGNSVYGLIFGYGCVTENNKVWTNDGRYIGIKELKREDGIIGSAYSGIVKNPIGTMITPIKKECLRITLGNNNYIECSTDHPILKQILHTPRRKDNYEKRLRIFEEGFVRANTLKIGDRIVAERAIPIFGKDTLFDARLVGMLIGDGTYGCRSTPCYSSQDDELVNYITKSYDITIYLSRQTKNGKNYRELRIRNICKNLREIGIYGQTKSAKRLPINYQTLDYDNTRKLLAGLFDTDGCVFFDKRNSCISLSQGNIEILKQVKLILKKFGISCSICKNKPNIKEGRKDKNAWYILSIVGFHNIKNFKKHIPLLLNYKKESLDRCIKWFIDNPSKKPCGYNDDRYIVSKIKSIENIGIQTVYNLSAVASNNYLVNNIITHNTAGDSDSDFASMQEIMYNPKGYNVKAIPNIYDKEGQGRKFFSYFFPGYLNRDGCYDKNGNSDVIKSILEILKDRYTVKYNTTDINAITKKTAEIPITPQEAIMRSKGNIFPITELTARLNEIDNNPNFFDDVYVGTLVTNSKGEIEFSINTTDKPIREFPTKSNKVSGALEIYEMPQKIKDKIPNERYIASLDNYENDESNTMSLGSLFVLDLWTDRIVAEYTGRPMFVDDLNEIARKVCLFYNAKLLYEAHPYSQEVHTPKGTLLWKDITIGSELFGIDGKVVKVVDIPIDTEMPIYKVTLEDGREIMASDNHLWYVNKILNPNKFIIKTTKEMMDYGCRNKHGNHNFFIPNGGAVNYEEKELPIDPYTIGLLLAEGCFAERYCRKRRMSFSSSEEDVNFYRTVIPYNIYRRDKNYAWYIDIDNCMNICKALNLRGQRSHTKFIPQIYLFNSVHNRMELLKGLMDGDGCANSKGAKIFITASKQLSEDIMSLCRSLGINCKSTYNKVKQDGKEYSHYRISIFTEKVIFKLPRKINKCHVYQPNTKGSKANCYINKTAIKSIEYSHTERAKCVTVNSEDGLYMIGDYVLTHNCNKKNSFAYFSKMNSLHLLADTPEYLKNRQLIKSIGYGNTSKGVNATTPIKNFGFTLIRDWLLKPVTIIKEEEGESIEYTVPNLTFLKNRALIKELMLFNPDINVDRIMSLVQLMLYREEKMILYNGDPSSRSKVDDKDYLGNDPFFERNYNPVNLA